MDIKDAYHAITPHYPDLSGRVAVITGGAKGIGQGIALRCGREGMRIVLADRDGDSLAATTAAFREVGIAVFPFEGDLGQTAVINDLFKQTMAAFGGVDLLVNNAADLKRKHFLDEHEALFHRQVATNITGPYFCSYQAARVMRDTGGGNIVSISSVGAIRAHWQGLPYDMTKGAINAMTQAMAIDLAQYNIRVNAIGPGAIKTYRTGSSGTTRAQEMVERIPLKRFGSINEIGAAVAFLASDESSYVTGQIIYVDGGISAQLSPPGQWL